MQRAVPKHWFQLSLNSNFKQYFVANYNTTFENVKSKPKLLIRDAFFGNNNASYSLNSFTTVQYSTQLLERPYNGPRKFVFDRELSVQDDTVFKVSFKDWNEQYLIPQILVGKQYYLLVFPNQSAKTSRIFELMNQIRELQFMRKKNSLKNHLERCKETVSEEYEKGITLLPLYVNLTILSNATGTTIDELQQSVWEHFITSLNLNKGILQPIDHTIYTDFSKLFSNVALKQLFGGNYPVLFLDEMNALEILDQKSLTILSLRHLPTTQEYIERARASLLLELRAIKHSPHAYCLQSVVGISNYMGEYLDIVKGTPFNVIHLLYGSYFTREQFNELVLQYEQQEQIKIDFNIVNDMYERTVGHPGQTILLLNYYHNMRQDELKFKKKEQIRQKDLPTLKEWIDQLSSDTFWKKVETIDSFQMINNTIDSDTNLQGELMRWILNRTVRLDSEVERKLEQAQIVKLTPLINVNRIRVEFVSPLVQQYVCRRIGKVSEYLMQNIPNLKEGEIDFVTIIEATIRQLSRWSLLVRNTNSNDPTIIGTSNAEQNFGSAFYSSLITVLLNARTQQHPLIEIATVDATLRTIVPDLLIEFPDTYKRIIVEHCINGDVDPHSKEANSLLSHVLKAEQLGYFAYSKSAYVIHWTSIPKEKSLHEYWFTNKGILKVNIIYICYDSLFAKFEIHYGYRKRIVIE